MIAAVHVHEDLAVKDDAARCSARVCGGVGDGAPAVPAHAGLLPGVLLGCQRADHHGQPGPPNSGLHARPGIRQEQRMASTSSDHHRSTGKDYNEARIRSQDSAAIARGAKRLPRLAASKLAPPQHSRAQPAQLGPGNPPDNNARRVMKRASRRGPARACSRRVTPAGHQLPRNRGRSPTRIAAHFGAARGWPPTRGSHGVSVTGRSGRCPRRR